MVIHNLSTIVEWELDSAYLLGYYTLMATPSDTVRETLPPSQLTECELIQELGSLETRVNAILRIRSRPTSQCSCAFTESRSAQSLSDPSSIPVLLSLQSNQFQ